MATGDIPEVEKEIASIGPAVAGDWRERSRAGIDALIEQIRENPAESAAIAAGILLLTKKLESPITPRFRARAVNSAKRIILAGITQSGIRGRLKANGPTINKAAKESADALVALSKARAQSPRFAEQIRENAEDLAKAERELAQLDKLKSRIDKDRKTEAGREKRKKDLDDEDAKFRGFKRKAIRGLKKAVDEKNGHMSKGISDFWAYRVYNLGVFLAAKSVRVEELVAINPKDLSTTPFCRWVHGKIIKVKVVERKIAAYRRAVKKGDREDMIKAWPFLNQSKAALKELRKENGGSQALGFRKYFARVGLPGYHWGCRTRAVPRFRVVRVAA
jgi:hypothetical protein